VPILRNPKEGLKLEVGWPPAGPLKVEQGRHRIPVPDQVAEMRVSMDDHIPVLIEEGVKCLQLGQPGGKSVDQPAVDAGELFGRLDQQQRTGHGQWVHVCPSDRVH
jgi:hypothetical protein